MGIFNGCVKPFKSLKETLAASLLLSAEESLALCALSRLSIDEPIWSPAFSFKSAKVSASPSIF